jgi:hypothetical protein
LAWKKIPPEADYFHSEPGTEYFICEEGFVLEGRYLQDDVASLDKAIWPTVQGSRAYIRVRRKGVDKKFQLVRIFAELFPELLDGEVLVRTRKGPFTLRIEADSSEDEAPARSAAPKARKEKPVRREREEPVEFVADSDGEDVVLEEDDEDAVVVSSDARICKICNLRKRGSEFSPRDDMCMDCYMNRDELLKEIITRRRRKTKTAAPRATEENAEGGGGMEDNIDSFGRMDFGVSLPD